METAATALCQHCEPGKPAAYCATCGQAMVVKRLSFKSMLHETFHFFTHLDKGFPYTLKRLATAPGFAQREYIEGKRSQYQKPFSMYFICASFSALLLYWIIGYITKHYHEGDSQEAVFFNRYWVLLQISLLPFYALVTWLLFKDRDLNYAEVLIFQLYVFAFIFLLIPVIHLLKFIWPALKTRYIELPVIVGYTLVTNFNFFKGKPRWVILAKTVVAIAACFFLATFAQDLWVKYYL